VLITVKIRHPNSTISSLIPKSPHKSQNLFKYHRPKVHFFSNFYCKIKQILEGYVGCLQFYDIRHLNSSHPFENQLVERKKNLQ
jgi:hypothetical protein